MTPPEGVGRADWTGNPYATLCMVCWMRSRALVAGKPCPYCNSPDGIYPAPPSTGER